MGRGDGTSRTPLGEDGTSPGLLAQLSQTLHAVDICTEYRDLCRAAHGGTCSSLEAAGSQTLSTPRCPCSPFWAPVHSTNANVPPLKDAEAARGDLSGGKDVGGAAISKTGSTSPGLDIADAHLEIDDGWTPTEEEDKELAITAEQDATWWHSLYHNTTASERPPAACISDPPSGCTSCSAEQLERAAWRHSSSTCACAASARRAL